MSCTFKSRSITFILGIALASACAVAQDKSDDKLLQYVRNAKKAGQKQSQVQDKAIKAGWPAADVSNVVASVYGTSNSALASNSLNAAAQPQPAIAKDSPATGLDGASAKSNAPNSPNGNAATGTKAGASPTGTKTRPADKTSGTNPPVPYEYRIGAGDILQISVWKEPEASANNVVVRPDGVISTPLTKELHVAGLTPLQTETLITEKLVKVIQEPDVTVVVTGINSKKIYLVGGLNKQGTIPYTYNMTVMQAVAEAGGLTEYAKKKKMYVLRNENGKETRFPFPYEDVVKGNHMEANIILLPGDTLVVPQ